MDRSRRGGTKQDPAGVPEASRLTVRPKRNRKRPVSLWARRPTRAQVLDACGRALRRSVPALIATVALAVLGGGLWLGYRFVTTSERFAIATIDVQGAARLSSEAVRAALPIHAGENIFTTDLDTVTRTLRKNPWIRAARARRVLPATIVVEISERRAVAIVQTAEGLYLADETGHPFKPLDDVDEAGTLPVITGVVSDADLVLRALAVLDRWRTNASRPEVSELAIDAHHAITLRTRDGVAIQLGALRELDARLPAFDAAWAELSEPERASARALHLDGRSDQVTVAFAPIETPEH
jgi:cell division septal protein FtsQ